MIFGVAPSKVNRYLHQSRFGGAARNPPRDARRASHVAQCREAWQDEYSYMTRSKVPELPLSPIGFLDGLNLRVLQTW
jgi:hypothetical protein